MQETTIKEVWQDFRTHTFASDIPTEELVSMRHVFYAGAAAMLGLLMENAETDGIIEKISLEVCEYAQTGAFES